MTSSHSKAVHQARETLPSRQSARGNEKTTPSWCSSLRLLLSVSAGVRAAALLLLSISADVRAADDVQPFAREKFKLHDLVNPPPSLAADSHEGGGGHNDENQG